MSHFENYQKTLYVHTLAIILEKLQIPFKFIEGANLEFDLHVIRDLHIDTTNLSVKEIDDIIKIMLTK